MDEKKALFFGGVPTDIEVKKLRDTYNEIEMQPGDTFPYDDVSEIIGEPYGSNRFQSITTRWRKIVEANTGKIIGCDEGKSFKVLTEAEKLDLSRLKLKTSGKLGRRSIVVLSRIDKKQLSDAERTVYDHQAKTSANIIAAAQLRRKIELPTLG